MRLMYSTGAVTNARFGFFGVECNGVDRGAEGADHRHLRAHRAPRRRESWDVVFVGDAGLGRATADLGVGGSQPLLARPASGDASLRLERGRTAESRARGLLLFLRGEGREQP